MDKWRRLARGVGYAALIVTLAAGALWVGTRVDGALGGPSAAYAAPATPEVDSRERTLNGRRVGEVLVNGNVVVRMRTSAGGFSAGERARMIADRLERWLSGRFSPYDLTVRQGAGGSAELRAAGRLIATVNPEEAEALDSTAMGLARAWRDNIMMALGVDVEPGYGGTPAPGGGTPGSGAWTPREPYDDKIVPILSAGQGIRIGAARINGPRSMVRQVNAVAQLETEFEDVLEIDIYVPITTNRPGPGGLDRVQEVGLTGIADLRL